MVVTPQQHWDEIYQTRDASRLSWFETRPEMSLSTVLALVPDRDAPLADIGGGTSRLVDLLLAQGYRDLTVLDIAEEALKISRTRLASYASRIRWIQANVLDWRPSAPVRLWHDRAVFHFFTQQQERTSYAQTAARAVVPGGFAVLEVFAPDGPTSCSGLPVYRASAEEIAADFSSAFRLHSSARHTHKTPLDGEQSFQTVVLERNQP